MIFSFSLKENIYLNTPLIKNHLNHSELSNISLKSFYDFNKLLLRGCAPIVSLTASGMALQLFTYFKYAIQ